MLKLEIFCFSVYLRKFKRHRLKVEYDILCFLFHGVKGKQILKREKGFNWLLTYRFYLIYSRFSYISTMATVPGLQL